jgi:4-hydroxy-3-polyprenylbenzoate decarboxylase
VNQVRVVVGLSGASGVIYGIRLLEMLRRLGSIETHVVVSPAARQTIESETNLSLQDVQALADVVHGYHEIGATIASGSFPTRGMVIAPCSVKTLSAIAYGLTDDLIARAADVHLKEGRPLILMFRETPLHVGHIKAMLQAAENGATLFPPLPAFYTRPQSIDDIVNDTVSRVVARLGFDATVREWPGLRATLKKTDD